jgi:hypothetical protein
VAVARDDAHAFDIGLILLCGGLFLGRRKQQGRRNKIAP